MGVKADKSKLLHIFHSPLSTQGANNDIDYIAAQGPLPHTIEDFWGMLWYHTIEVYNSYVFN